MSSWQIIILLAVVLGFGLLYVAVFRMKLVSLRLDATAAKWFTLKFEANAPPRGPDETPPERSLDGTNDQASP